MSTTIYLLRHGETAWNADRRLQGHTDIGLNEEGRRQAGALGQALAGAGLEVVIASDLERAHHTALAVAGPHGLETGIDVRLRERCYGAFEGLLRSEIAERYPAEHAAWQAREVDAVMPAGLRTAESFRHFYRRSVDAIKQLASQHAGRTIALVAHGGVLECAYREALGMPLDGARDFAIRNAAVNRFSFADGKLSLLEWGNVSHLEMPSIDELG